MVRKKCCTYLDCDWEEDAEISIEKLLTTPTIYLLKLMGYKTNGISGVEQSGLMLEDSRIFANQAKTIIPHVLGSHIAIMFLQMKSIIIIIEIYCKHRQKIEITF